MVFFERWTAIAKALRLNEQIRISPVRVIDQHQNQLGVIPTFEALTLAREAGLDLVEVSPMERPPVCRIIDYGKHVYEKKKRQKVAGHSHVIMLKEIRLRPKTDVHDREVKLRRAREFLDLGHKVQFTMLFRGRERFHRDLAQEIFQSIVTELGEAVKIERPAMMDGKRMTMVVSPGKASAKPSKSESKPASTSAKAGPGQPMAPAPPVRVESEKTAAPEAPAADNG